MATYRQLVKEATAQLEAAGVDTPALDARILMEQAGRLSAAGLLARGDDPVLCDVQDEYQGFVARRLAREPVARILGEWEFRGLPFRLNEATLIPRPDTETLVEVALEKLRSGPKEPRLVDVGTGSGAILIALLHECPEATGTGIDISPRALEAARHNAALNRVAERARFEPGDFLADFSGPVDMLVSNPPYIMREVIKGLEPEVRLHDPEIALDGGEDGLDAYRAICARLGEILAPDGVALFEIGCQIRRDLAHCDRVAILTHSPTNTEN